MYVIADADDAKSTGHVNDNDRSNDSFNGAMPAATKKVDESGKNDEGNGGGIPPLDGDGRSDIELAFHLRDGCCHVDAVEVYCPGVVVNRPRPSVATAMTEGRGNDEMDVDEEDDDSQKRQRRHRLRPLPRRTISFAHHDPLSVFMTRQTPLSGAAVEDGSTSRRRDDDGVAKMNDGCGGSGADMTTRRYEADSHATRGTRGMTYGLRAASISSAMGELRVIISRSSSSATTDVDAVDDDDDTRLGPPDTEAEAHQCWMNDMISYSYSSSGGGATAAVVPPAGESARGGMEGRANAYMIRRRCHKRREVRFDQVAKSLAGATATMSASSSPPSSNKDKNATDKDEGTKNVWPLSAAMKIVVRFSMSSPASSSILLYRRLHLSGINFIAPPPRKSGDPSMNNHPSLSTPHVYTTSGTHGDHQGVRSWLPTLDSASPKHRASHEFLIKVTSIKDEGLWPVASGEDFGYNLSVSHPILLQLGKNDDDDHDGTLRQLMMKQEETMNEEKMDAIMMMTATLYQKGVAEADLAWKRLEEGITDTLGRRHARFINDFFYPDDECAIVNGTITPSSSVDSSSSSSLSGLDSEMMTQIMKHHNLIRPTYVTSMFSSLTWLPCPSRSLGFAIGPFATLFDPEYFHLSPEDDDDDEDGDEVDDDQSDSERRRRRISMDDGDEVVAERNVEPSFLSSHRPLSLLETAHELGEGIRQLYFAPRDDRRWIHEDINDVFIFGKLLDTGYCPRRQLRPELSAAKLQDRQQLEGSILASTLGVPNRALSLMRDVLALPAYRTSSYTQIWIPYAQWSGDSCGGNMIGCPEVGGCNPFLGGAIIDSTLLPPPGMRLPYYEGGKYLQYLQARNAIRGWVRTALPLGSNDDVGQGYLHALIESFLMSLYERGHGAFGEGGGKGSLFYTKRYAISSGLNSPNLDFLPLVNVEDDEIVGGRLGAVATGAF
jgi:hypothetical protein